MHAFGLYEDENLIGAITYGKPASPFLCRGICGEENSGKVIELNRLVIDSKIAYCASFLIGGSLRSLPRPSIVVSYSDTAWHHIGYVYQATNWLYTGCTGERTDAVAANGRHPRHCKERHLAPRRKRSAKHRYVIFVGSKLQKRRLRRSLKYSVFPYPKGDIGHYKIDEIRRKAVA